MHNIRTVTVIMITYNPELNKALETINSIILQKNINIKIIIADDCSRKDFTKEYMQFFFENKFDNYIILKSEANQGTVRNIARCSKYCVGDYVKIISPGDYLYGHEILKKWADYMEEKKIDISIGDAYYYERTPGGYNLICEHAFPQKPNIINEGDERKKKYYQLIYNDYWLGAATLIEIEAFKKYIKLVSKFAVYGEDNMYRLAACDGVSRGYYPVQVMMYETNTGISSLGDKGDKWHKTLMEEWIKTNEFIIDRIEIDDDFKEKFIYFVKWRKSNMEIRNSNLRGKNIIKLILRLIPLFINIPGMFVWFMKRTFFKRKTSMVIDDMIVNEIFDISY